MKSCHVSFREDRRRVFRFLYTSFKMVSGYIYVLTTITYTEKKMFYVNFTVNVLDKLKSLNRDVGTSDDVYTLVKHWKCNMTEWNYICFKLLYFKCECDDLYMFPSKFSVISYIEKMLFKRNGAPKFSFEPGRVIDHMSLDQIKLHIAIKHRELRTIYNDYCSNIGNSNNLATINKLFSLTEKMLS